MKNIIPKKINVVCVVGKPIDLPRIECPSQEQVQKYLDRYIAEIKDLYSQNSEKYNEPKNKPPLEII